MHSGIEEAADQIHARLRRALLNAMIFLKAKYVVCAPDVILKDACIAIENGIIKKISANCPRKATYDLGNAIITPGLINPHTHLEGPELYGYAKDPLKPPQKFTEWAVKVIALRQDMHAEDYGKVVQHGYDVCARNGITTIADHSHIDHTINIHIKAKLRRFLLEEVVALDKKKAKWRFGKILDDMKYARKLMRKRKTGNLMELGLAPHSPFSVSPEFYRILFHTAVKEKMVMSTHLAELKEEVQFLKTGRGKMLDYLRKIGRDTPNWEVPGLSPVQYLKKLGILKPPAFFVHCNYLTEWDINLLASSGASVVFCPRSHNYFGHRNHPFRKLLKAGVNVALGTDGLGSNSDLSILGEMQFVRNHYDGVTPQQIFKMGTINGAKALGLSRKVGVLKPSYAADIAAFPVGKFMRPRNDSDILAYLIEQSPKSIFTMVNGSVLVKNIR